jgi:ketosteroid isomerase-like protein
MKKTKFKSACILVALALITMNTYSQSTDDVKSKIEKMNKDMAQAIVEGNHEKSLSYYAPDAISLPSYSKMVEGIDAIKQSNMEMSKSGTKFVSFEFNTLKLIPAGNMYTEIGTYKVSMTMAGMDAPMNDVGKYVTIWEKQKDGSLKIKVETWNTDNNPWSNMDMKDKDMKDKKDKM